MWREAEGLGQEMGKEERKKVTEQREICVCSRKLYWCAGRGMWMKSREPKEISPGECLFLLFIKFNLISRNLLSFHLFNFLIYPVRDQPASPTPPPQRCPDFRWRLTHVGHPSLPQIHSVSLHCVLRGNFNCSQRMLSHVTSTNVSKLWSLFPSPLSFLAHTRATR